MMSIAREESSLSLITKNSTHKNAVPKFRIRPSKPTDIESMVSLTKAKRLAHEKPNRNLGVMQKKQAITHKRLGLKNC